MNVNELVIELQKLQQRGFGERPVCTDTEYYWDEFAHIEIDTITLRDGDGGPGYLISNAVEHVDRVHLCCREFMITGGSDNIVETIFKEAHER